MTEKYAKDIQKKISAFCLKENIYYNKSIRMSKSGFPDIIIVLNSITYYFEVKAGKDKLSELQVQTINKLNRDKKIAFVIGSFNEFKTIYDCLPKSDSKVNYNIKNSLFDELDLT